MRDALRSEETTGPETLTDPDERNSKTQGDSLFNPQLQMRAEEAVAVQEEDRRVCHFKVPHSWRPSRRSLAP
jgi:hypothetical protein